MTYLDNANQPDHGYAHWVMPSFYPEGVGYGNCCFQTFLGTADSAFVAASNDLNAQLSKPAPPATIPKYWASNGFALRRNITMETSDQVGSMCSLLKAQGLRTPSQMTALDADGNARPSCPPPE
jgi:hypothetical protein